MTRIILVLLFLIHNITVIAYKEISVDRSCPACGTVTTIASGNIGITGYTISVPGQYCLESDIAWNPSTAADVITIAADNVILDLNGRTITQTSGNNQPSNGVIISAGSTNIIVKNGTLSQLSLSGISIAGNGLSAVMNILIEDVRIKYPGGTSAVQSTVRGINCVYGTEVIVKNCEIAYAMGTSIVNGLSFTQASNIIIDKCLVAALTSNVTCIGYNMSLVTGLYITNSVATNLTGTGGTAAGFLLTMVNDFTVDNCSSDNHLTTCADVHGFSLNACSNGTLVNCQARENTASGTGNVASTDGFDLFGCNNCNIESCFSTNNSARNPLNKQAAGFTSANSNYIIFKNFSALGNNCTG